MINKPLLKQIIKSNFRLFAIITLLMCALIIVIMSVFVPSAFTAINNSSQGLPFNPLGDVSTLIAFLANQYFGMMAIIFPMIYVFITGNKLIAAQVDKGSLAFTLATPTSRKTVAFTSAFYLVGSLLLMYGLIFGLGVITAEIAQPGILEIGTFFQLTLGCFLLQFAISSITFFATSLFNTGSKSMSLGAGLPLFFFAMKLISGFSEKLESLKYLSMNTLFDTFAIQLGKTHMTQFLVMFGIGLVLYIGGIVVFNRKDLPL
jgi:ABC-2 type transport system permease protein